MTPGPSARTLENAGFLRPGAPVTYVILQHINLGLFALLGELGATANWRAGTRRPRRLAGASPGRVRGGPAAAWAGHAADTRIQPPRLVTLAASGLPRGGDIGVESTGFVPPGFGASDAAYLSDR
jgi:hypothetical protein